MNKIRKKDRDRKYAHCPNCEYIVPYKIRDPRSKFSNKIYNCIICNGKLDNNCKKCYI